MITNVKREDCLLSKPWEAIGFTWEVWTWRRNANYKWLVRDGKPIAAYRNKSLNEIKAEGWFQ